MKVVDELENVYASGMSVPLQSAPIPPTWVRAGTPEARNAILSSSADGLAMTLAWDCTAGEFKWEYDIDETIYFVEGTATISTGKFAARKFGPGDVLFLSRGTVASWRVETYVRKVAFCRVAQSRLTAFPLLAIRMLSKFFLRAAAPLSLIAGPFVSEIENAIGGLPV